jgi:hypothetical protein
VTQLDILYRGDEILLLIESAQIEEYGSTDSSTPRPESGRLGRRTLVHVVMVQVLVLGNEVLFGRVVIVRAEHRRDRRLLDEVGRHLFDGIALDDDIGIDEEQNVTGRLPGRQVTGATGPGPPAGLEDTGSPAPGDGSGPVRRQVIDDDDLVRLARGSAERIQAPRKKMLRVIRRHDHRYPWLPHPALPLTYQGLEPSQSTCLAAKSNIYR